MVAAWQVKHSQVSRRDVSANEYMIDLDTHPDGQASWPGGDESVPQGSGHIGAAEGTQFPMIESGVEIAGQHDRTGYGATPAVQR